MQRLYNFCDRPVPNLVIRTIAMFIGIFCVALGIALSRETGLGTSPISSIPAVISFISPITMGQFTFVTNSIFFIAQLVLLRRKFKPIQFLQLPMLALFSWEIDMCTPFCQSIPMSNYFVCFAYMILSATIIGFGVFLEFKACMITTVGEAIVITLAAVTKIEQSLMKRIFDCSNVAIAVVISLIAAHALIGVREGAIIAAVLVGTVVKICNVTIGSTVDKLMPIEGHPVFTAEVD